MRASSSLLLWSSSSSSLLLLLLLITLPCLGCFDIEEATIDSIHEAFQQNKLTSRQLVHHYLHKIRSLNPLLNAVIEINPDALHQAEVADLERMEERKQKKEKGKHNPTGLSQLHGIPILLKDNIATADKLNTTAGSLALLGSVVCQDAGVVKRLREAGAVILGKASLSEWAHLRSSSAPSGWCARGGQGKNPYVLSADPCGSSSGSAIGVAANLVTLSLGTETDGSIICPSSANAVVGIKPTVGLTSRAGVIPISQRQDTVGPICRTVADAVYVLDAIVGYDPRDKATQEAAEFIPHSGYRQFLKADGLKEKRLGIVRTFFEFEHGSVRARAYEERLHTMRQRGAILVDNLEIENLGTILYSSDEDTALYTEFKLSLNAYLSELVHSPVRSLADVISFNKKFSAEERLDEYGQDIFLEAQRTNGFGKKERDAVKNMTRLSRDGFEKLIKQHDLDAVVTPENSASKVLAIGGYPGISVPAGFDKGVPFGICFGGVRGSEPKLIEIAYAFEQATKIRKPPPPLIKLSSSSPKQPVQH